MNLSEINELIAIEIMEWRVVKIPSILVYEDEIVWLREDVI